MSAHLSIPACLFLAACTGGDEAACAGFLLSTPEGENAGSASFSAAELMAHSAAMGMTQQEDGGKMLNTRQDPLRTAMVPVLHYGALGAHDYDDLQTVLAGRNVGYR